MFIVAGQLFVAPDDRDAYLQGCVAVVTQARTTRGCVDFSLCADLLDPARINVFERWETAAAVTAFRGDGTDSEQTSAIVSATVAEYEVVSSQSLT